MFAVGVHGDAFGGSSRQLHDGVRERGLAVVHVNDRMFLISISSTWRRANKNARGRLPLQYRYIYNSSITERRLFKVPIHIDRWPA